MNLALAASTTIDMHDEWVEALWLATEKTVTSRANTEVAWSVIENDRQRGNAERRRRHTDILLEANDHLDPERGALRVVDASAMLGAWMAHTGYGDEYAAEPENIDDMVVCRWLIEELARRFEEITLSHHGDGKAVLIVLCGMDWLDREWGAGRPQRAAHCEGAMKMGGPDGAMVLIITERGGARTSCSESAS